MTRRRWIIAAVVLGVAGATAGVALARPGGGEGYSGGGGHGGGGGGGGGDGEALFELIYWLIRLSIHYPQIGLPLLGCVFGYIGWSWYRQHVNKDWDSGPPVALKRTASLDVLRQHDPHFSRVVFEDFVFRLFSSAHRARHSPEAMAAVAPYVGPSARQHLLARGHGEPVVSVVVGALRTVDVQQPPPATPGQETVPRTRVTVELEANVGTARDNAYTVETWVLVRAADRLTKPPTTRTFPCPNCNAPWRSSGTGTQVCASCGEAVDNGRFDWSVESVALRSSRDLPPNLTTEVAERGTDLATYRAKDLDGAWQRLQADDPELSAVNLMARLKVIHRDLSAAWSNNDLRPIRGYLSDGMYDYLEYWVDAYRRQGLRNQLSDPEVTKTELAKVERDRWYDAVTIRFWGRGKDFVVRSQTGQVVRGSKHRSRAYSEYWTLVRARGRRGPAALAPTCGNCGAPLRISMAGECEHCNAHVTAGEFDWVLSKIEQDDSYRG